MCSECVLSYLGDGFYNNESVITALKSKVDAITVVEALRGMLKEIAF